MKIARERSNVDATLKHMLMGSPEYPEGPNSPMDSEIILNCDRTNGKD